MRSSLIMPSAASSSQGLPAILSTLHFSNFYIFKRLFNFYMALSFKESLLSFGKFGSYSLSGSIFNVPSYYALKSNSTSSGKSPISPNPLILFSETFSLTNFGQFFKPVNLLSLFLLKSKISRD